MADNRHTELGGWDDTELAALLESVGTTDAELLTLTGYDHDDLALLRVAQTIPDLADFRDPADEPGTARTADAPSEVTCPQLRRDLRPNPKPNMNYRQTLDHAWASHLAPRADDAPTVVSLLAGAGGSSLGYSMAGYRELLGVEWDTHPPPAWWPRPVRRRRSISWLERHL